MTAKGSGDCGQYGRQESSSTEEGNVIQIIDPSRTSIVSSNIGGKYGPSSYLNLLFEVPPKEFKIQVEPARLYSERELDGAITAIMTDLGNAEDWEVRLRALAALQGLALGDGMEYSSFPGQIRSMHALLIAQIADLRSTLCKEACRTVAVLARRMGTAFVETSTLFIPSLLKQACVKTQIMAQAAGRCLQVLVTASSSGNSRVLAHFFEQVASKNASVSARRTSMECICLASSLWPNDVLEKVFGQLKVALNMGVVDADKDVRKTTRQLFWVIHARPVFTRQIDGLLRQMEQSTQKHVQQEKQKPDEDLEALLSRPFPPPDNIMPSPPEREHTGTATRNGLELHRSQRNNESTGMSVLERERGVEMEKTEKAISAMGRGSVRSADVSTSFGPQRSSMPTRTLTSQSVDDTALTKNLISSGPSRRVSMMVPQRQQRNAPPPLPHEQEQLLENSTNSHGVSAEHVNVANLQQAASIDESNMDVNRSTVPSRLSSKRQATSVSGPQRVAKTAPLRQLASTSAATNSSSKNCSGGDILPANPGGNFAVGGCGSVNGKKEEPSLEKEKEISIEELKGMSEDSHWEKRVSAMEHLKTKLAGIKDDQNRTHLSPPQITVLGVMLDIMIARLDDAHHKVSIEALGCLETCVGVFASNTALKLSLFLPALFTRLADKRPHIREKSNALLNTVRSTYDACSLVAALGPRLTEVILIVFSPVP